MYKEPTKGNQNVISSYHLHTHIKTYSTCKNAPSYKKQEDTLYSQADISIHSCLTYKVHTLQVKEQCTVIRKYGLLI